MGQPIIYPAHERAPLSRDYAVRASGKVVPVFETCSRYGPEISFATFDTQGRGPVDVEVEVRFAKPRTAAVPPGRYGIKPRLSGRGVTFTVAEPETYLSLIIDGDYQTRPLHLFVNGPDEWGVKPGDAGVVYFGPGYHELPLGEAIELGSGQTLLVAGGAWVNGAVVVRPGSRGVRICGHGILAPDQQYDTRRHRGIQVQPGCSHVTIEGVLLNKRVTGWCGVMHHSTDVVIRDYKVLSGAIWSTDGLNPCNCSRVSYRNCFFRCGDDNIAIKGFREPGKRNLPEDDPGESPPNEDITVQGCTFWSDNNNAVVLGQETKTARYRNIHFRDCDVLYTYDLSDRQGVISLICLDGTDYSDISFENIRVGCLQRNLVNIFFTEEIFDIPGSQKWKGRMRGITFRDISVAAGNPHAIRILGWNETNAVEDVTFRNVRIGDRVLDRVDPTVFRTNEFVRDLRVET